MRVEYEIALGICGVFQGLWEPQVYSWAINQSAQQLSDFLRCTYAAFSVSGVVAVIKSSLLSSLHLIGLQWEQKAW